MLLPLFTHLLVGAKKLVSAHAEWTYGDEPGLATPKVDLIVDHAGIIAIPGMILDVIVAATRKAAECRLAAVVPAYASR